MRIISGRYKSRKIHSPAFDKTAKDKRNKKDKRKNYIRPTSDRTRETIFDILQNFFDFADSKCLDLFAGTGSLGLECLSRGASYCTFVDISKNSIRLLEKTTNSFCLSENIRIIKSDCLKFLKENKEKFDIIFADPPYAYDRYNDLLKLVFLKSFKIFVLEIGEITKIEQVPENIEQIIRKIGNTFFYIFVKK